MDPDMNLQINTLYVGNLPSSPPPPGYGPNHLEDSLRSLFSNQPGYRKLCFRQKSNGPMCFVEVCPCLFTYNSLRDVDNWSYSLWTFNMLPEP
jgi:hypothetical protein